MMNLKNRMKKITAALLILSALFIVSCGETTSESVTETPAETSVTAQSTANTEETTKQGEQTPTETESELPTVDPTTDPATDPATATETETASKTETPTKPIAVTGVKLDKNELTGTVGEGAELIATVLPENADNKLVTFSSSDEKVVTVNGATLRFVGEGKADVTCKTSDGGFTAVCRVTVKSAALRPNDVRYGEDGLPNYQPTYLEGVEYEDFKAVNVKHLFCHDLVAFEDKDGYFYSDCLTVTEFNRILEQLYARGYVLIDIDYMYDYAYDAAGNMTATVKNTIKVPKGKKPIILSVDNVAFPRSEHGLGRADRLEVVDGRLVTYTKMPDGSERISEEDDVFPILENFVAAHPDFSFDGAKCVVAPSGYDGLFGWDTIPGSRDYEKNVQKAREVAEWLVDHGFSFACHSYSHSDFSKMTVAEIEADMKKWNNECASVIGKTHVFIYPFGSFTKKDSVQGKALTAAGFSVFCSTSMYGVNWNNFPEVGNAYNERITLASKLLVTYKDNDVLNALIDPYTVYDNDAHKEKLYK